MTLVTGASPLGRYSELAATIVALAVLGAWCIVHLAVSLGLVTPTGDASAIDTAATLVIGVILGQRATTNGAGKIAMAAHLRLDRLGAPPADDGAA